MTRDTSGERRDDETEGRLASENGGALARAAAHARREIGSGVVAGVSGGVLVLRGLRALHRGKWSRAVLRFVAGGALLAVARAQRSDTLLGSDGDEQTTMRSFTESEDGHTDIHVEVATSGDEPKPDGGRDPETEQAPDASGDDPKYEAGIEYEPEGESEEPAPYERFGAAAFNEHVNEVPAPQRAFDLGFLALGSEAEWGIRESDDRVLVSQDYDAIAGHEGVRYVGSSPVDQERVVSIPDPVVNHWDELAESSAGVVGGDDIVFGTNEDLWSDHVLVVVPEEWSDELEWEE